MKMIVKQGNFQAKRLAARRISKIFFSLFFFLQYFLIGPTLLQDGRPVEKKFWFFPPLLFFRRIVFVSRIHWTHYTNDDNNDDEDIVDNSESKWKLSHLGDFFRVGKTWSKVKIKALILFAIFTKICCFSCH